ncbi:MAG: hybrid sensor histidine kinase/response regulator [Verrucomicrobiia bacterium]|jgi:two-component system sensor histidine kinase/response regulator
MSKILVVDDDDQLRQTIIVVLKLHGFEPLEANNGGDALEIAREHLPDLIISDVNMPGQNGFEALASIRQDPTTAAIPLILMTGEMDSNMRKGMELGADDFLTKPFAMPELLKAIDARMRKQTVVKQAAEKKLAELRESISLMLPHELNTPLVGILGFGQIIHSCADSLSVEELTEMGKNIMDSGLRLERLIQNFLVFAQLQLIRADDAEALAMRQKVTNNSTEVITMAARARAESAGRMADLEEELQDSRAEIAAEMLTKIVEEVVGNAFKFSSAGKKVRVSTKPDGDYLQIQVIDSGRGMNADQLRNIDAYVQFDRKLHEQQGSGLGLAITKQLCEVHGGKIHLESNPETGTTVTVTIPAQLQKPAAKT